ncbi:unnamed protein product [Adineta ricciae]|uniref:Uncharacterized protein n=1 Tax=Adineta ricciae TaxID=249248 RepID=A0A814XJW9_ADIRI|nr:unnamed protein product [Adineta ricciae]
MLKSTLPSMPQLSSVYLESQSPMNEIFSPTNVYLPITNLTTQYLEFSELLQILHDLPLLNCLNVGYINSEYDSDEDLSNQLCNAVHLRKLNINEFPYSFEKIKMLLQCTPNLAHLALSAHNNLSMFDAHQWEDLIVSSLHNLNAFKFSFTTTNANKNIMSKLKQFRSDFWLKKHQWFTDYVLREDTECYIPCADSLILTSKAGLDKTETTQFCEKKYLGILKTIVNLSNIRSLRIPKMNQRDLSLLLTEILKEAPRLTSLSLYAKDLLELCNNELCQDLNKRITNLHLDTDTVTSFRDYDELNRFCKIFPSISQMTCGFDKLERMLYLMKQLSSLSVVNGIFPQFWYFHDLSFRFGTLTSEWNAVYEVDYLETSLRLRVWIGRE